MDKRKNNGGHSTAGKAGRPSLKDELKGVDLASPHIEESFLVIAAIMKSENEKASDRIAAAKLLIEYGCGKPTQEVKQTNLNVEVKDLDDAEIKRIAKTLDNAY
jgi:hypothetical protein